MQLSEYVVDCLSGQGAKHGFFIIGGALGYLADACARKGFRLYTMHHEQAAAFAAEGQSAVTGGIGVAMATSGPGATNLVTGIGSAYFASFPVVFLTGQVNTFESNLDGKRRQVGFQETDIVSIAKPITKYAVQVTNPESIVYELEKAFFIAKSGRMGPVLIDLPLNVQKAEINPEGQKRFISSPEHAALSAKREISPEAIARAASLIASAKRPILLAGHGVRLSGAQKQVADFIEKAQMPMVATLMGTDVIDNRHKLYYGFIGTYGGRHSNFALANADLMLVLGARLDSRQVGVQSSKFAPGAKVIHVDIDQNELGASIKEELSVNADISEFMERLLPAVAAHQERQEWIGFLNALKAKYSEVEQDTGQDGISPKLAISALCAASGEGDMVSVDVGSHQMWFAQSWTVKKGQFIMTNGGMGPMGCSLPTALGMSLSSKASPVWVVVGDGSLQLNIQELQTAVRHKIPVKIMVINNRALGMLTQFQTENFGGRMVGSLEGYDAPDFVKVAEAYGLAAKRVEKKADLQGKVEWLSSQPGPALLDVIIPQKYWVLPKSSYARPVHEMKPLLGEEELREALKYAK